MPAFTTQQLPVTLGQNRRPSGVQRDSYFARLFDQHGDGDFVKILLPAMLLLATVVQPFSLIYTAYGDNPPTTWWTWTPALAVFFFLALDWTITPMGYFFATTAKPALKIVIGLLLAVVAFGAFEGYFTATERLIQLRLSSRRRGSPGVRRRSRATLATTVPPGRNTTPAIWCARGHATVPCSWTSAPPTSFSSASSSRSYSKRPAPTRARSWSSGATPATTTATTSSRRSSPITSRTTHAP